MTPQVGGTDQDGRANRRGGHERPPVVLRQPAVAHLVRSPTVSDHGEDMRQVSRVSGTEAVTAALSLPCVQHIRNTRLRGEPGVAT